MSSSSSLSSARKRRVGSQNTVQNPPASVRDSNTARLQRNNSVSQESVSNNQRGPSMNIPSNEEQSTRAPMNPAQLLMQHDYRIFQLEKLVKSMHEELLKDSTSVKTKGVNNDVNMDEIKHAVSDSIYESSKLKEIVSEETKNSIEQSYDFDSFYDNLQKLSDENQVLKDTIISNQKYMNEMNTVILKLLNEFRELNNLIKEKHTVLETINEVEETIDNNSSKENENDEEQEEVEEVEEEVEEDENDDEPDNESEEEQ